MTEIDMRMFGVVSLCSLLTLSALAPTAPAASTAFTGSVAAAADTTALAALEAPPADSTFTVGTLRVQRYGDHGRPLILIPGLEGGSWVWRDVIEHLRGDHVIYAVTLAGFDGIPPPKRGDLFDLAYASLLELIQTRHIERPVLVGHSIGGVLAIRFAGEHSGLLSGLVAVEALPVVSPRFERMSAAQREAALKRAAQSVGATEEEFRAGALRFMQKVGMLDSVQAARYAALNARSDRAAVVKYVTEALSSDYRPGLENIRVPLLEISPYNPPDFANPPGKMTEAQKTHLFESQLAGAPRATVVSISPARHFVMLDRPAEFRAVLSAFLAGLCD